MEKHDKVNVNDMMRLIFLIVLSFEFAFANGFPGKEPDKEVKELFPGAINIKWFEGKEVYTAYFVPGEIVTRAFFDPKGDFKSIIRYYRSEHLPALILLRLNQYYPGLKVLGVTERSDLKEVTYFLKLEDEIHCYEIQSDASGNLTELHKYVKG